MKKDSKCEIYEIINPKTNNCVSKTGKTSEKILNLKTDNCVLKSGKINHYI